MMQNNRDNGDAEHAAHRENGDEREPVEVRHLLPLPQHLSRKLPAERPQCAPRKRIGAVDMHEGEWPRLDGNDITEQQRAGEPPPSALDCRGQHRLAALMRKASPPSRVPPVPRVSGSPSRADDKPPLLLLSSRKYRGTR